MGGVEGRGDCWGSEGVLSTCGECEPEGIAGVELQDIDGVHHIPQGLAHLAPFVVPHLHFQYNGSEDDGRECRHSLLSTLTTVSLNRSPRNSWGGKYSTTGNESAVT
jgi:hypothetical protein